MSNDKLSRKSPLENLIACYVTRHGVEESIERLYENDRPPRIYLVTSKIIDAIKFPLYIAVAASLAYRGLKIFSS